MLEILPRHVLTCALVHNTTDDLPGTKFMSIQFFCGKSESISKIKLQDDLTENPKSVYKLVRVVPTSCNFIILLK